MKNKETINAILHKIRHTKGLEHLLELREGCEISLETHGNIGNLNLKLIEPYKPDKEGKKWLCTQHMVWDGTGETTEIIGHTVQWSDVLVAMPKNYKTSVERGVQTDTFWCKENNMGAAKTSTKKSERIGCDIDLTKLPEQNMLENEELVAFLADLLGVKENV